MQFNTEQPAGRRGCGGVCAPPDLAELQHHVLAVVVRDELEVLDRRLSDAAVEVETVGIELRCRVGMRRSPIAAL